MKRFAILALALLPVTLAARQADDEVAVAVVRFYRAEASLTQVKAFVQVPLALLTPSPSGVLAYQVSVQLKDSTGLKLDETAWPVQHINAELRESGAFTVSSVEFLLRPGKYRLDVTVDDSVGGRRVAKTTELVGYPTRPPASDLVLSTRMRPFNADSSIGETEWRSGQILVTSIAHVRLNPATPNGNRIFYLLEAYTADSDSGSMQVSIKDTTGRSVVQTAPIPVHLAAGGGVLRGQLNLEGLPSGEYQFDVSVQLVSGTTDRSMPFTVLDLQAELERQAQLAQARRITDEGYFAVMSEEELDRAEEPLEYLVSSRELRAYHGATIDGKRRFLTNFWHQRDADTTDLRNPVREEFYGKIAYADSVYRERGSGTTSGWKTDRGRIYAKYGSPDELQDRVREGRAPPYQIWRYTRRRDTWYVFADRSGMGNYKLVQTNDRFEVGIPGWKEIMTLDAVREIGLYLGVDFFGPDARD
ncbi:MAG TPA: GWxTD domain-containing protein [Gemmatimonadales bacterium]|nr:GWxTD domain-containing protein [Gemmatimonadales bacterium]